MPRREFLIEKKTGKTLPSSVVEVVIPARKKANNDKKVKFNKTLLIDRKRKLEDVTNVDKKARAPKKLRTIDDLLNAPLPPIVSKTTNKRPKKPLGTR